MAAAHQRRDRWHAEPAGRSEAALQQIDRARNRAGVEVALQVDHLDAQRRGERRELRRIASIGLNPLDAELLDGNRQ